ncbi:hypothetical protein [Variovorax sp. E3]|uniref:hypothetical protein n=1 Tax=Variovorax sp. E3 TaxID=1914993 RepID=UPI0022B6BD98|nr:hypothetical protein [Variovorax sp. E3]
MASFLGLRARKAQATGSPPPDAVHLQDAAFWKQLVASQQAARQGRLMAPVAGNGSSGGSGADAQPPSALESIRSPARWPPPTSSARWSRSTRRCCGAGSATTSRRGAACRP